MPAFRLQLRSQAGPISIEDYRLRAKRALPEMVWSYVEHGAEDLSTLRANRSAFDNYYLRTRVLTGREGTKLAASIAGADISLPVLLAPTGLLGMSHWTGELGAARAAERAGTLSILSAASSYSIEEVGSGTTRGHFFQLYPWAKRDGGAPNDLTRALVDRARKAGFSALFVTVDVPIQGNREAERRRGMGNPPVLTPRRILDAAARPRWSYGFLRHGRISARNFIESVGLNAARTSLDAQYRLMRPDFVWDDLAWIRDQWRGPLFVKGILDPEDAERAVALGADGIVVSNHGGRQLDGAVASLDALPAIARQVGGRAQILLDGGIRRGTDVIKALCLGAHAVCIGRPYIYGIASAGPPGVESVLNVFREELGRALTLMGVGSVKELDRSWLIQRAGWEVPRPLSTDVPSGPHSAVVGPNEGDKGEDQG